MTQSLHHRKEEIFQEKMKESWDRFEEERTYLRTQITQLRKQAEEYRNKWEEEQKAAE